MNQYQLIHIEDDEDWRDIIGQLVTLSTDLEYIPISLNLADTVVQLKKINGPSIVVMDLRLEGRQSEYQTIVETLDLLPVFQEKGVDIFFLSGHLPQVGRSVLRQRGIPDEHIFEKGRFEREEFVRAIKNIEQRMQQLRGEKISKEGYKMIHLSDIHIGQENKNSILHRDVRNELLRDLANVMCKFRQR